MTLAVIRGTKPRHASLAPRVRFDWDAYFHRQENTAPPRPAERATVIPLLEGWVRVLERRAAGDVKWRRTGRG